VNRVGTEIGGDVLTFVQNPQHPVAQAGYLFGAGCASGRYRHKSSNQ
jgi:hypothetical protein